MIEIPLTRGMVAIVDEADFAAVSHYKWHAKLSGKRCYAARSARGATVFMHNEIMGHMENRTVDHRNPARTLDNRRENLRWATNSEQCRNRGMQRNNSSGYRGVSLDKGRGRWKAKIKHLGRWINLGYFATPELAHAAYCAASNRHHGEFGMVQQGNAEGSLPIPGVPWTPYVPQRTDGAND